MTNDGNIFFCLLFKIMVTTVSYLLSYCSLANIDQLLQTEILDVLTIIALAQIVCVRSVIRLINSYLSTYLSLRRFEFLDNDRNGSV